MKANQKFRNSDEAVSPVIAVILMVAITVVLAATVYVWVSGFGSQSSQPAKTLSLTSSGSISQAYNVVNGATNASDFVKNYTIASATSGMKFSDMKVTLDGSVLPCEDDSTGIDEWRVMQGGSFTSSWVECTDSTGAGPAVTVNAGNVLQIYDDGSSPTGKTLRILDTQANSVILTLTIG